MLKILLIGHCCGATVDTMAQQRVQYIMLDMLDSLAKHDARYQLNRHTLNTTELYGVDETIEMYNFHHIGLALFSVLPDFTSDSNWSEVDIADIQGQVFDEKSFLRMISTHVSSERNQDKKSLQYTLVKQEGGQYFKSNFCLAEFFYTVHYSSRFNTPYGTLNTGQDLISIKEMKRVFDEGVEIDAPKTKHFPLDVRAPYTSLDNWWLVEREYLSRELEVNGEKAYQFWTFTDWRGQDNAKLHRGIDRFIYMPGRGIVAGSYDFHFLFVQNWIFEEKGRDRHTKTPDELWQNVLEEKVMLAEELK